MAPISTDESGNQSEREAFTNGFSCVTLSQATCVTQQIWKSFVLDIGTNKLTSNLTLVNGGLRMKMDFGGKVENEIATLRYEKDKQSMAPNALTETKNYFDSKFLHKKQIEKCN